MRYFFAIFLSAALFVGCDFCGESLNHFYYWIPCETTAERQMEIQRVLESEGWTNICFCPADGVIYVSADRK